VAAITKRDTASGPRYDVRWRTAGKARERAFKLRRDAEAFKRQVEHDELRGVVTDLRSSKLTVAELSRSWLAARPSKRPRSVQIDSDNVRLRVLPQLGDYRVTAVTRGDVQRLVDRWIAQGLAPSTVARSYSTLRALMSFAEADEVITRSPCRAIRLPQVGPVQRPQPDPETLERLAVALGNMAPMMWTGAILGLRWAEVAGLRPRDIDVVAGTISVVQQLGQDGQISAPKSAAGVRTMAAPAWLLDQLTDRVPDGDLVFGQIDYHNWRSRVWVPACGAAGCAGLRFHDLRSLNATTLVAAGVDPKTAQVRLGHANVATTLGIYARATAEADRLAVAAVDERLGPRDLRGISDSRTDEAPSKNGA
jgi:integrase